MTTHGSQRGGTRPPSRWRETARTLAAAPAAAGGGWAASQAGLPLAWLTGATLVTVTLSLAAGSIAVPRVLYRAGQTVVGVSVGLTVTSDILGRIGWHVALIPLAAALSILIGTAIAPVLARVGRLSPATAHFSMMPAGISEMAELAGRHGADVGAVATLHTLRVMLVVFLIPPLVYALHRGDLMAVARGTGAWDAALAIALAAGLAGGFLGLLVRLPSSFMLGPMLTVALLSGSGLVHGGEPKLLLAGAQVVLGLTLGARLRRDMLARLPRAIAAGMPALMAHSAAMAGLGSLIALASGSDPITMILCFATGGSAEMVLTARAVAADAALVAAYQLSRGFSGNAMAEMLFRPHRFRPPAGP